MKDSTKNKIKCDDKTNEITFNSMKDSTVIPYLQGKGTGSFNSMKDSTERP
ncbi:hypothetical protein Mcup_1078 [Metallosphaera cuprina Ar-4]|uniref:Uncharacterized protein n=1 Tax=Metallosphaera cuprina (strain Ar-4) TaxID=1006006 RepID=F4G2Y6_METCR|nr:hypothetical protein Mcup_1078 [Metallosphaera cuprina Ar-4]